MKDYYLPFDGTSQRVELDTYNLGNVSWRVTAMVRGYNILFSVDNTSIRGYIRVHEDGLIKATEVSSSTAREFATGISFAADGPFRKLSVYRTGGVTYVEVDDVYLGIYPNLGNLTLTNAGSKMNIGCHYRSTLADYYSDGDMQWLEMGSADTVYHRWDARNKEGVTGGTWVDEVGTNDGTLINFATNPWAYDYTYEPWEDYEVPPDNCLAFDSTNSVTFAEEVLAGDFTIDMEFYASSLDTSNTFILSNGSFNGTNGFGLFLRTRSADSNAIVVPYYVTSMIGSNDYSIVRNAWYSLRLKRVGTTNNLYIDDMVTPVATFESSATIAVNRIMGHANYTNRRVKVKNLVIEGLRHYDFNLPLGTTTIPDLLSNADATANGFPARYLWSSGAIYAYRLPKSSTVTTPDITLAGDFEIRFRYETTGNNNATSYTMHWLGGSGISISGWHNWSGTQTMSLSVSGCSTISIALHNYHGNWPEKNTRWYKVTRVGSLVSLYTGDMNTPRSSRTATSINTVTLNKLLPNNSYFDQDVRNLEVDSGGVPIHDFDFLAGTKDIHDTIGGLVATTGGVENGFEAVSEPQTFTAIDYPLLSSLVAAESNADYLCTYTGASSFGAVISDFPKSLIIEDGEFTSEVTLTTTGTTIFNNMTLDDVDATGATGDVLIIDSEAQNVTG